jgi:hypothetical protein
MPESSGSAGSGESNLVPSQQLQTLRADIAKIVGRYFLPLLIVTMVFAILLIYIIGTDRVTNQTIEKMALAASIQVAFGMLIGYVCVYVGLMMTWFGIEAAYSFKGSLGSSSTKSEMSLQSASPGLLFALGGMVLIAVCLYKPIVFDENSPISGVPLSPPGVKQGHEGVQPMPPKFDVAPRPNPKCAVAPDPDEKPGEANER